MKNHEITSVQLDQGRKKSLRASSNPPSVLSGIPLSSQPEQLQGLELYLALLHLGRQFQYSIRNLRLFAITVRPD